MSKPKHRKLFHVYRDAGTGRFVTRVYADEHPDTTIRQRVRYCNPQYKSSVHAI